MKGVGGKILYIGKAGNLKRRVSSYFNRPHDHRIQKMVSGIKAIEIRKTDTAIEALILESALIKKLQPPFNVLEKDDKSFLYVEITRDKFPRVLLVRGKDIAGKKAKLYGPFTSASSIREALKIVRRIFPYSIHGPGQKFKRPCFEYEIGLCPGVCAGVIGAQEYRKNIAKLKLFFEGKKARLVSAIKKEMKEASKALEYEKAEKLKRQLFALKHIQDVALISEPDLFLTSPSRSSFAHRFRIEGYDISNISGESAVGSMVVFAGGKPDKNEYRKFKIRYFAEPNPAHRPVRRSFGGGGSSDLRSGGGDTGMMKEVLRRRFGNSWTLPDLILVDGGAGQINAAKQVLNEFKLQIPVIGLVKGPKRKRNDFIGFVPKGIEKSTLIKVRDEAHRFAISYHRNLRSRKFFEDK